MPVPADSNTLLVIESLGVPIYSARNLTQTFTPIKQAEQLERSINGVLMDWSYSQFQKYQTVISCKDFNTPMISGLWPGQTYTVSCVFELPYLTSGAPLKPVVSGSIRASETPGYSLYRPKLTMMMGTWDSSFAEWSSEYTWQFPMFEV